MGRFDTSRLADMLSTTEKQHYKPQNQTCIHNNIYYNTKQNNKIKTNC